jgi:hypothetical protein
VQAKRRNEGAEFVMCCVRSLSGLLALTTLRMVSASAVLPLPYTVIIAVAYDYCSVLKRLNYSPQRCGLSTTFSSYCTTYKSQWQLLRSSPKSEPGCSQMEVASATSRRQRMRRRVSCYCTSGCLVGMCPEPPPPPLSLWQLLNVQKTNTCMYRE